LGNAFYQDSLEPEPITRNINVASQSNTKPQETKALKRQVSRKLSQSSKPFQFEDPFQDSFTSVGTKSNAKIENRTFPPKSKENNSRKPTQIPEKLNNSVEKDLPAPVASSIQNCTKCEMQVKSSKLKLKLQQEQFEKLILKLKHQHLEEIQNLKMLYEEKLHSKEITQVTVQPWAEQVEASSKKLNTLGSEIANLIKQQAELQSKALKERENKFTENESKLSEREVLLRRQQESVELLAESLQQEKHRAQELQRLTHEQQEKFHAEFHKINLKLQEEREKCGAEKQRFEHTFGGLISDLRKQQEEAYIARDQSINKKRELEEDSLRKRKELQTKETQIKSGRILLERNQRVLKMDCEKLEAEKQKFEQDRLDFKVHVKVSEQKEIRFRAELEKARDVVRNEEEIKLKLRQEDEEFKRQKGILETSQEALKREEALLEEERLEILRMKKQLTEELNTAQITSRRQQRSVELLKAQTFNCLPSLAETRKPKFPASLETVNAELEDLKRTSSETKLFLEQSRQMISRLKSKKCFGSVHLE